MNDIILTSILHGLLVSVEIIVIALLLAAPLALAAALGSRSGVTAVRVTARVYIEFLRGTSALVQLFWAFFVLPEFGLTAQPFLVGVVVLGLNASAYGAEIVRGAIQAVPKAQWEVAMMLGLARSTTMRKVIFPQALPIMLPALGNIAIDVMKASALVSLIAVSDFTREVTRWATTGVLDITVAFTLLLAGYLALSLPISGSMRLLEIRASRFLRASGKQRIR